MKFSSKLVPFLMLPVFALGCSNTEDDTDESGGAATASTALEFTASVGAVVVDGKRVCTAALVDVDAGAQANNVSLSGRQVVLGGSCIGKLKTGYMGGAAFVTQQNGVSLATPIVDIDFASQAGAGLAVGILSDRPADAKPLRLLGFDATVNAGIRAATVLRANDEGGLIGASVSARASAEFNLVTQCTEWHFKAASGVAIADAVAASEQGFGGAAIVKVNGELRFAASIDGQCILNRIDEKATKIADKTLESVNSIGDAFAQAGAGKMVAIYDFKQQVATVRLRFFADVSELRINAQGRVSASAAGSSCGPELLGSCKLNPEGGFKKGQVVDVTIDTHNNVFPDPARGTRVFVSIPQ